ncbi:MAG: hypothetical protein CMH56_06160 [Myxococcales bacterium]|nr:hypothetical protein [Myxococcales bacterium]
MIFIRLSFLILLCLGCARSSTVKQKCNNPTDCPPELTCSDEGICVAVPLTGLDSPQGEVDAGQPPTTVFDAGHADPSVFDAGQACEPCDTGYELGADCACVDVDECAEGTDDCHVQASCNNLPGSFECICKGGYEGDGRNCTDIDGCASQPCFAGVICTDVAAPGEGFSCGDCPVGYEGNGENCTDIDGCASEPCFQGVVCTDVAAPGEGYVCDPCPAGYDGDGVNCNDIDECVDSPCGAQATCSNSPGTYACACDTGYAGDGINCYDIDECLEGDFTCGDNSVCENASGTYNCVCNTGYFDDGSGVCTPHQNCDAGRYVLSEGTANDDRVCETCTTGSFSTTLNATQCSTWTTCEAGSLVSQEGTVSTDRTCSPCPTGAFSTEANSTACEAWSVCGLGEYQATSGDASQDTVCDDCGENTYQPLESNNNGVDSCLTCADGYESGIAASSCTNINECLTDTFTCPTHSTCVDTDGDYDCPCDEGYEPQGEECIEIDDCPDDPLKMDPGVCGCGVADTNSDGDSAPDCIDDCPNNADFEEYGPCGCLACQDDAVCEPVTGGDFTKVAGEDCDNDCAPNTVGGSSSNAQVIGPTLLGEGWHGYIQDYYWEDYGCTQSAAGVSGGDAQGYAVTGDGTAGCNAHVFQCVTLPSFDADLNQATLTFTYTLYEAFSEQIGRLVIGGSCETSPTDGFTEDWMPYGADWLFSSILDPTVDTSSSASFDLTAELAASGGQEISIGFYLQDAWDGYGVSWFLFDDVQLEITGEGCTELPLCSDASDERCYSP